MKLRTHTLCSILLVLTGCVLIPPYNEVDYGRREDGSTYIRDTARTRAFWKNDTDRAIANEIAGDILLGGTITWEENWRRVFRNIRAGQENPEHYISYIIEARRKASLPEIKSTESEPNQ